MRTLPALAAVIALSLAPLHAQQATSMPTKAGKYTYHEAVNVAGATAAELYSRALLWSASAYGSGPGVTQVNDPSAGRLVLNGLIDVVYVSVTDVDVRHTVTIEVKDGGYSYTITDFVADFGKARKPMEEQWSGRKGVKSRTHEKITALIESLKKQMTKASPVGE